MLRAAKAPQSPVFASTSSREAAARPVRPTAKTRVAAAASGQLHDRVELTNEYGVARLSLEPGIHFLELRLQDSVVLDQQILAIEDEISQWIVDISAGGSAFFDVE